MRLVDADNARECFGGDGVTGAVMKRMFDSLPTIDAVPVVRCRDCEWFNHYTMAVPIEYNDVFKDKTTGETYRVTSNPEDKKAPRSSTLPLKYFTAERWTLTT